MRPIVPPKFAAGWVVCVLATPPAIYLSTHDPDRRIRELSKQIDRCPADAALYVQRAEVYRQNRMFTAAQRDLGRAAQLDPTLEAQHFVRGCVHRDQGRKVDGVAALGEFLAARPGDARGLLVRGRMLAANGEWCAAARDFATAVRASAMPRPDDYLQWARALAAAGDRPAAIAVLDAGIDRLGSLVSLHSLALELQEQEGLVDAALSRLKVILSDVRRKEAWLCWRGSILAYADRVDEAVTAYRAARAALDRLPRWCRVVPATDRLACRVRIEIERLTR